MVKELLAKYKSCLNPKSWLEGIRKGMKADSVKCAHSNRINFELDTQFADKTTYYLL